MDNFADFDGVSGMKVAISDNIAFYITWQFVSLVIVTVIVYIPNVNFLTYETTQ
jgi:hypothetical protein